MITYTTYIHVCMQHSHVGRMDDKQKIKIKKKKFLGLYPIWNPCNENAASVACYWYYIISNASLTTGRWVSYDKIWTKTE